MIELHYSSPNRSFFERDPATVARLLLGAKLIHEVSGRQHIGGIIVETEAYLASNDGAAHNNRGQTKATRALFMPAGTVYIHQMRAYVGIDIVTEKPDQPSS